MSEQTIPASVLVFGLRVKHLRKTERWTQAYLGAEMTLRGHPWHGPTVSKSESGERVPSLTELLDLADIFEVDPALLYDASPRTARSDVAVTLDEVRQTAAQVEADGSRLEGLILELLLQHRGSVDRLMRSVDRVEDLLGHRTDEPATHTADPLSDPTQTGADPLATFADDPLTEPHDPREGRHGPTR